MVETKMTSFQNKLFCLLRDHFIVKWQVKKYKENGLNLVILARIPLTTVVFYLCMD